MEMKNEIREHDQQDYYKNYIGPTKYIKFNNSNLGIS
jgi:hypothetical protein